MMHEACGCLTQHHCGTSPLVHADVTPLLPPDTRHVGREVRCCEIALQVDVGPVDVWRVHQLAGIAYLHRATHDLVTVPSKALQGTKFWQVMHRGSEFEKGLTADVPSQGGQEDTAPATRLS